MSEPRLNLLGHRYGRLTVRAEAERTARGLRQWICACDCGHMCVIGMVSLRTGNTKSCGCLYREGRHEVAKKHGATLNGKPRSEYRIWGGIIQRCTNPNTQYFECYGGRGITVCDSWRTSFENFLADMGPRPSPKHSVERKDNDGPYSPDNCRWATEAEQKRNNRHTRLITFQGETLCITDWAARVGLSNDALTHRINSGWPLEAALTGPVGSSTCPSCGRFLPRHSEQPHSCL